MNNLSQIINQYKTDNESVYNTWFIDNDQRLKAFRTIRRGVIQVVDDIKNKTFPNDFKGSSLEFVLSCIAEQKQIFVGVSHPFYWKPSLEFRIFTKIKTTKSLLANSLKIVSTPKPKSKL